LMSNDSVDEFEAALVICLQKLDRLDQDFNKNEIKSIAKTLMEGANEEEIKSDLAHLEIPLLKEGILIKIIAEHFSEGLPKAVQEGPRTIEMSYQTLFLVVMTTFMISFIIGGVAAVKGSVDLGKVAIEQYDEDVLAAVTEVLITATTDLEVLLPILTDVAIGVAEDHPDTKKAVSIGQFFGKLKQTDLEIDDAFVERMERAWNKRDKGLMVSQQNKVNSERWDKQMVYLYTYEKTRDLLKTTLLKHLNEMSKADLEAYIEKMLGI